MTGRRYSWGNCPPQGSFLGANIADSAFLAAFDGHVPESVLRDVRGNVFTESLDWSFDDGFSHTSPVGSFPKRPAVTQYALFDMSGNAREWTLDAFSAATYTARTSSQLLITSNPIVNGEGHCIESDCHRVIRGGSWADACCPHPENPRAAMDVRVDTRGASLQTHADDRTGFRLACSPSNISDSALLPHVFDVPSIHSVNLREVVEGYFTMGTDDAQAAPEARPAHRVWLDTFFMSAAEVTVAEFRKFVALTNYTPSSACRTVAGE